MKKYVFSCLLAFCVFMLPTHAISGTQFVTQTASGLIQRVQNDGAVRLDDGHTYFPALKDQHVSLAQGQAVTLRYFLREGTTRMYFEFAPGISSLEQHAVPEEQNRPGLGQQADR